MSSSSKAIATAAFAVAIPFAAAAPTLLATPAQAATTPAGVAIQVAPGVKCRQSTPSTSYVAQFTCTNFNSRTATGAPVSVQLPNGWYKVNVENRTTESWSGYDVLATPHDRWNAHVGTTQAITHNTAKSFSYYDAEGDWSLVSPWNVDIANRSGDTADNANVVITVVSTAGR